MPDNDNREPPRLAIEADADHVYIAMLGRNPIFTADRKAALAIGREIIKKAEKLPRSYEVFISYRRSDAIEAALRSVSW